MVTTRPLRIVFFGTPAFAVPSLERLIGSRHPVVGLVSQPDRPRGRGQQIQLTPTKAVAQDHGIPVLQPDRLKDPRFLEAVRQLQPDLGVVAAYGRLLPDALLGTPRLGMINVHGSILPAYRGAAPVHRAVIAGERETGVTIMRVVAELDAGPTLASRRLPIDPDATSAAVEEEVAQAGADLLVEVVDEIAAGTAVETPQDHSRATYAPKITKDDGRIDWNQSAQAIHNLVRGLHPWPLASARLGGRRVIIHRTTIADGTGAGESPETLPGTVLSKRPEDLLVACGDRRLLRVLEIQPEGKRVMTVREFLSGHPVPAGSRFEPV